MTMGYIITLDSGTTNTRAILWNPSGERAASANASVGVRNTAIDGNTRKLSAGVRDVLESLLKQAEIGYEEVEAIFASGMITSNVGLVEVPHLTAPAGAEELAAGVQEILLPDICPKPICFIPGIKNFDGPITPENFEQMDIMRGEETESIALIHRYGGDTPMLLVLPGSHMKFVAVDCQGRITGCLTSISGELLNSITPDTILADAVGHQFVSMDSYDPQWVHLGARTAEHCGLGRACFSGRILSLFASEDHSKIANFVLGACLASDIRAVSNSTALACTLDTRVVVAGKAPMQQAMAKLLREEGCFRHVLTDTLAGEIPLSAQGALQIARLWREEQERKQ